LRIIAKAKSLQLLVKTFIAAIIPAMNTFGIAFGVWMLLGCVGMQLFAGKMYRCSDPTVQTRFGGEVLSIQGQPLGSWDPGCVGVDDDGNARSWDNYDVSFDDIIQSVRTMVVLTTQDNWPGHMLEAFDARSKNEIPVIDGPSETNWILVFIFLFCSVLICAMVVINMVIGVFVECYNTNMSSTGRADPPPLKDMVKKLFNDPVKGLQGEVFRLITKQRFDMFVAFFIVANVVSMAVDSFKSSSAQKQFDMVSNYFFTYVFGVECFLKMWTMRMHRYFDNGWNKFDFFIVMMSYIGVLIDNLGDTIEIDPTILRILRIFRIFRILRAFRIFKALKSLQNLVKTIFKSLPSMGNLVAFLFLFFFIWSVLGVVLYGNMCKSGDEALEPALRSTRCLLTGPDDLLGPQAHLQAVEWTLITLFRVSTGDAWGDVMGSMQLASEARSMDSDTWEYFTAQLGKDPSEEVPGLTADSSNANLELAALALAQWNATVTGLVSVEEPESVAEAWAAGARLALPTCITEAEAKWLEARGLMDCRVEYNGKLYHGECSSTCGGMNQPWLANIYLMIFFTISSIILLQLVIAVLMDQLSQSDNEDGLALPGCKVLNPLAFNRMRRRWERNARDKLKFEERWVDELHNHEVY